MQHQKVPDAPAGPLANHTALPAVVLAGSLALILVLALIGSTCDWTASTVPEGQADWNMFAAVVQRVKSGEPYYAAYTTELRARGYPNDRVFNWRMPALTLLLAALPDMRYARGTIIGLIAVTLALWFGALRRSHGVWHAVAGVAILAVVLLPIAIPSVAFFGESWAGLLIVLSLGAFATGLWPMSVAAGTAALLIRELALPYVLVMFVTATMKKRRAESAAWGAGLLLFGGAFIAHRVSVGPYLGTPNPANLWLVVGGACFVALTGSHNAIGIFVPGPLRAAVVGLALLGFIAWRGPTGSRATLTVLSYVVAFLFVGRPDNGYWGLVYSPVLFLGFVFLPAALAAIFAVARSRSAPRS